MKAYEPVVDKYSRQATYYDHRWNLRWGEATLRATVEAVPWDDLGRILDVGCGTGALEQTVRPRLRASHNLVGVDIALPMLQLARRKVGAVSGFHWTNSQAENLPFQTGAFDGLICNNSFHYYRAPQPVLNEFHRVLRPGGTLVFADWCYDFITPKLSFWLLRLAHHTYIHRYALSRVYRLEEFKKLLGAAGFQVASAERIGMEMGWGVMVVTAKA